MGHAAAELALELYVFLAVLRAVFDGNLTAVRADELFGFEFATSFIHGILAGLASTEVGLLAFKALVV